MNGAGRVTEESVKVYEVYPGLPGENRYRVRGVSEFSGYRRYSVDTKSTIGAPR